MAETKLGLDDFLLSHSVDELLALPTADTNDPRFQAFNQDYLKWKLESDKPIEDIGFRHYTDLGNGERLALRQRDETGNYMIHYSNDAGWRYWDGHRWKIDTTSEVGRRAVHAVRLIPKEADNVNDKDEREKIFTWATRSEAAARISSMIEMARLVPGVSVESDIWDKDQFLLNFQNGTMDLNTGELRAHRREDFITKCLDYDFDPDAQCPVWDKFLDRVQPNELTRRYLLKAAAYCLSGSIDEQCVFILHGEGENGKTKFLEGVFYALGGDSEYAGVMPTESLMIRNNNDTAHEIAMLKGKRFIYAVEPNSDSTFNSSFIKQQTGGEQVMGRHLYKDFFTFMPTHKLWIGANHDVKLAESDHGIQRRLKQTPFGVTITSEEKDGALKDKLVAERQGIMACLVKYWLIYKQEGLTMPPEVVEETKEYFDRVNPLKAFIDECCNRGEHISELRSNIHKSYVIWSKNAGDYKPMKRLAFYARLKEQGFKTKILDGTEFFIGLALKEPENADQQPWYSN